MNELSRRKIAKNKRIYINQTILINSVNPENNIFKNEGNDKNKS
jgi:hypothetical protein